MNLPDQRIREHLGSWYKAVYEAVKADKAGQLSGEGRLFGKAIEDHLDIPYVHNALEFADVRGSARFEVGGVNPIVHLAMHAAIEGQIEQDAAVRAAFDRLVALGAERHQAIHILTAFFAQCTFEIMRHTETHAESNRHLAKYRNRLRRIRTVSRFAKKQIRLYGGDHPWGRDEPA